MKTLLRSKGVESGSARGIWSILSLEGVAALLFVLTGAALLWQDALTRTEIEVNANDVGSAFVAYAYDDSTSGGRSKFQIDERRPLEWACALSRAYEWGHCGFGVLFDVNQSGRGLDLSRFETIRLRLDYRGAGKFLRINLKNQDPKYVRMGAANADKYNQLVVPVSQGVQTIELSLSKAVVAEWWRAGEQAAPELANTEFYNVIALEILTGNGSEAGLHRVKVENLQFEGRWVAERHLYGGALLCWMLLIAGLLWLRREQSRKVQEQLATSWRRTIDTIPHMVWTLDRHGTFFCNLRWEEFTGVPSCNTNAADVTLLIHPEERGFVVDTWETAQMSGEPFSVEYRMKHLSGEYRWVLAQAVPSIGGEGIVAGWYGTCTDVNDRVIAQRSLVESVTRERKKAEQLKWWSEHDALTSLPNRRAFQARVELESVTAAAAGQRLALLLIDLDHFKHVNDSLGHAAGDNLLRAIGDRLKASVRSTDLVARLGGDEFAVVLTGVGTNEDVLVRSRAVLASIQAPLKLGKHVVQPGASIGAAILPRDGATAADLLKAADAALYTLKRSGRGGIKLFDKSMLEWLDKSASQLRLARDAVERKSIIPVYQAKVDVLSGRIEGFEALLRFPHPSKGLQLPETIEEAFKDYELAAKIGELMQRGVARDIRSWVDRGLPFGTVSINASPAEFLRDDYAERFLAVLKEENLDARHFELEVTEHALLERGPDYVARALTVLKASGIRIALDDFGTGYSSLAHLRDFAVDLVKIDKSFVQQMIADEEIRAIVAAVVDLARNLNIAVVAEGVETAAQLELLGCMGCELAQGHLFGKATDFAETVDRLENAAIAA